MRRPLPVPVEPLSPQRWAKVERGLFSKLESGALSASELELALGAPTPHVWVWWAIAAAALVLTAAGAFVSFRGPDEPAAEARASRIMTGREGSHLALPGLSLDVEPESTVVVGDVSKGGVLIVLDRGGVVFDVAPRTTQAPLIVQAGAAQVRVVGTRFRVQRQGESVRVAVEHGLVEVSIGGHLTRVGAGQVWPLPAASAPSAAPSDPGKSDVDRGGAGEIEPQRRSLAPRRSAVPDVGTTQSRTRFERAAALERTSPEVAISLYRGLETGTDSWAANALFAHGRLELARGNRAEGRRLLERYLARFPRGGNSGDAEALLRRSR